jgi:hypothetical protein
MPQEGLEMVELRERDDLGDATYNTGVNRVRDL